MCLPPEKGAGRTILGKLRLRALTPPRDPSLSPAWPWVWLTGHPCSCRDTVRHKWPAAPGREALVQPRSPAPAGVGFLRAGPQLHTAGKGRGAGNLRRLCPPRSRGGGRPSQPPPWSQPPAAICLCPSSGRGGAGPHSCTRPSPQLPSQTSFFPSRPRDPHPNPWQCLGGLTQECWGGCPSSPVPWGPSTMSPASLAALCPARPLYARLGWAPLHPPLRAQEGP